jgi:hypothetical protein
LNEKVGSGVGRFRPFTNDVVETQVELVEGEHLM